MGLIMVGLLAILGAIGLTGCATGRSPVYEDANIAIYRVCDNFIPMSCHKVIIDKTKRNVNVNMPSTPSQGVK